MMSEAPPKMMPDEPPPFLGTWPNVYVLVLAYEALVIATFYLFTRAVS